MFALDGLKESDNNKDISIGFCWHYCHITAISIQYYVECSQQCVECMLHIWMAIIPQTWSPFFSLCNPLLGSIKLW